MGIGAPEPSRAGGSVAPTLSTMFARRVALRRRVLVQLTTGRALRGVLWQRRGRLIVLRSAEVIEPGRAPVEAVGDVLIEADRVEWVQVLPVAVAEVRQIGSSPSAVVGG